MPGGAALVYWRRDARPGLRCAEERNAHVTAQMKFGSFRRHLAVVGLAGPGIVEDAAGGMGGIGKCKAIANDQAADEAVAQRWIGIVDVGGRCLRRQNLDLQAYLVATSSGANDASRRECASRPKQSRTARRVRPRR